MIVVKNAKIYTMSGRQPRAEALAIKDSKIVWVGANDAAPMRATQTIDAHGATVLPGLIDSHFHLVIGAKTLDGVLLHGASSLQDLQAAIAAYAAANPAREWIRGQGWPYSAFPPGCPVHRRELDAIVSDRPVVLEAFDYHTAWANTRALELAGLLHDSSRDPQGFGKVVRDADGVATGELLEPPAMDPVRNLAPPPTPAQFVALTQQAMGLCNRAGITSVHNMDSWPDTVAALRTLKAADGLTVRVNLPLLVEQGMGFAEIDAWVEETRARGEWYAGDMLRCGGFKLFMDGVVESGTAWMIEPYADGGGNRGAPNFSQEEFDRLITRCDAHGGQVAVHAIGDASIRATLNSYAAARKANGARDSRHRIEHVESLHPDDVPRFAELGVMASFQPIHSTFGTDPANPWQRMLGPERTAHGMPWRTLLELGVPMPFGSDWPVATYDPRPGIHAALMRGRINDHPAARHHGLSRQETLHGYTAAGAWAEFQEHAKGVLQPGYQADLIMVDQDWFECTPAEILKSEVRLTMVGGKIVHEE